MPAGSGVAPLADVPDGEPGHGPPELVIRRKHPVIPVPVLPRRRDEIRQPVEELKRRELDDAFGSRPRGLPPATPPDPVGPTFMWFRQYCPHGVQPGAAQRARDYE
jgi:hypothetical protein